MSGDPFWMQGRVVMTSKICTSAPFNGRTCKSKHTLLCLVMNSSLNLRSDKETCENLGGHYETRSLSGGELVLRNKNEMKRKKALMVEDVVNKWQTNSKKTE